MLKEKKGARESSLQQILGIGSLRIHESSTKALNLAPQGKGYSCGGMMCALGGEVIYG
jgi:hypothetical protein